jgi:hypothetical protein
MEELRVYADIAIRRACGFAGLAIGTVMLSLSFDLPLACRTGAVLTALMCGLLALLAWRAPRDVRRTEFWSMFAASHPGLATDGDGRRIRALARQVWRDRLVWHAERVGLAALGLWAMAGLTMLAAALRGA